MFVFVVLLILFLLFPKGFPIMVGACGGAMFGTILWIAASLTWGSPVNGLYTIIAFIGGGCIIGCYIGARG